MKIGRKMSFCKKNENNSGNAPECILRFLKGLGPILMVFIDQNMQIHDFSSEKLMKIIDFEQNLHQNSLIIDRISLKNHEFACFDR